jgi:tetratricopeptide (TPR) repeat protein
LGGLLLYTNTLHHGYVLDDFSAIKENNIVRQGIPALKQIFQTSCRQGYVLTNDELYYRPLSLNFLRIEAIDIRHPTANVKLLPVLALVFLFSAKTWSRSYDWRNNYTLSSHDVKIVPNSAKAHYYLGRELIKTVADTEENPQKRTELYQQGIAELEKAVRIYPNFPIVYTQMGAAYARMKNYEMAIANYNKAVELKPWRRDRGVAHAGGRVSGQLGMAPDRPARLEPREVDRRARSAFGGRTLGVEAIPPPLRLHRRQGAEKGPAPDRAAYRLASLSARDPRCARPAAGLAAQGIALRRDAQNVFLGRQRRNCLGHAWPKSSAKLQEDSFFTPRALYRRKPTMSKPQSAPPLNSPTSVSRVVTSWRLFSGLALKV